MILNEQKLDDRVIHASQSLMKRMFPQRTGLRDTVVLEGAERWDDKTHGFVQIVFDQSRLHWICVSNKFSEDGMVEIFDTAPPRLQRVPACVQRAIAVIMKSQGIQFKSGQCKFKWHIFDINLTHSTSTLTGLSMCKNKQVQKTAEYLQL